MRAATVFTHPNGQTIWVPQGAEFRCRSLPYADRCRCWAPSCTCPRRVAGWCSAPASSIGCARTGEGPRLVLVAAPAGFGKTTLLAQWLAAAGVARRVAWLALDPGDADLRLFLTHLVAAIQTAEPEAGVDALALLEAGGTTPTDAVLVSLINDLDVLAGPTVVALDDYHVIDGAAVHEAVTFLLDNLPPQVTLAMTTRADPPLPLSRLRARGELVEVRAADLRFTTDEAEVFLNEVMGLQLEPASWPRSRRAPRGGRPGCSWPRCRPGPMPAAPTARDVAGFVEAFSGSHRFVLDYLVEEVLDRQPDEVRAFLLDTSVLDQMTGGLCDALTGRSDGRPMLETLERENLFVVAARRRAPVVPLPPPVRRRFACPAGCRHADRVR